MNGACAALGDTAAKFRAGQTDHIAKHPEERRIGFDVDLPGCSVDLDDDHCGLLPASNNSLMRAAVMVSAPFRNARDYAITAACVYTMLAIFLIAFAGSDCRSFPQDYRSYGDYLK